MSDKTKIDIIGTSEGAICFGKNKPIGPKSEIFKKTFSANDLSIQCDICQAIVKQIFEYLAEGIPSDAICAESLLKEQETYVFFS